MMDDEDKALLDLAVRGMQDDLPDDARMRRLERLVAMPVTPEHWWLRTSARVGLGALALALASGAWVATHRDADAPRVVEAAAPVVSAPAPVVEAPAVVPVVSVDSLPSVASEPPRAPAPRVDVPEDPGDELALLEEARHSLAADPARTLALADTHAKRFRHPALAQERERLAIEALVRLGRRDEATTRAQAFEATYPDSAHLARIRALVTP